MTRIGNIGMHVPAEVEAKVAREKRRDERNGNAA